MLIQILYSPSTFHWLMNIVSQIFHRNPSISVVPGRRISKLKIFATPGTPDYVLGFWPFRHHVRCTTLDSYIDNGNIFNQLETRASNYLRRGRLWTIYTVEQLEIISLQSSRHMNIIQPSDCSVISSYVTDCTFHRLNIYFIARWKRSSIMVSTFNNSRRNIQ